MRCDGQSLLSYKSELLSVLKLTLHVVCKEVLTLSCMLLKHVLKSLTLIYANDYRSSTIDWDLPLSQVLPIRVLLASVFYFDLFFVRFFQSFSDQHS